eukprot:170214-Prorocentrum_minimum.AAC.1
MERFEGKIPFGDPNSKSRSTSRLSLRSMGEGSEWDSEGEEGKEADLSEGRANTLLALARRAPNAPLLPPKFMPIPPPPPPIGHIEGLHPLFVIDSSRAVGDRLQASEASDTNRPVRSDGPRS